MRRTPIALAVFLALTAGCTTFRLQTTDSGWEKAGKVTARTVVGVATLGISEMTMDRVTQPWKYQRRPMDPGTAILLQGLLSRPRYYQPAPMVLPAPAPYYPYQQRQLYCTPAWDGMGGQVCR